MKIFDSHCHPQFPQYDGDREEMIARAINAGVSMVCVGTDLETSKQGIELAQKHQGIWATVGIHPNALDSDILNKLPSIVNLLSEPKVVAIGEVGLDYYRTPEPEKQKLQKEILERFIELAIEHDKPIILHARDAGKGSVGRVHADMISIIENCKFKIENSRSWRAGVAHSFTGTTEEAQKYLDLGFYLGFNGIITFPPSGKASKGQAPGMYDEMIRTIPLDRILIETDAPYLTPEPHRGERNEPSYVDNILRKLSQIRGEPQDLIAQVTTSNCRHLFEIE